MAVYFDHRIQAAAPGPNNLVEWHKTFPVVAVGSYNNSTGGAINLYQEEVIFVLLYKFIFAILTGSHIGFCVTEYWNIENSTPV